MPAQTFTLGAVLSVTTGRLLAPFDEVHRLIEHLAGEPVWTHQLPRVSEEAAPSLLAQHPALASVVVPDGFDDWAKVQAFLDRVIISTPLPASLEVEPMLRVDHTSIHPVAELRMMHPDAPIISVAIDPEERP